MKKDEGTFECYNNGLIAMQCSIWDILSDKEEKQMKKLIRAISKRNRHPNIVTVTFSVETQEEERRRTQWEQ